MWIFHHTKDTVSAVFTIFSLCFSCRKKGAEIWALFVWNYMESECFKKSEPLQQPTQHTSKMDRPDSPMSMNMQANSGGNLMSNGQGNNKMMSEQHKNRICRDFVRGSCRRLYCKYPHVQSNDLVVFCHDYQNSKCPRMNCK